MGGAAGKKNLARGGHAADGDLLEIDPLVQEIKPKFLRHADASGAVPASSLDAAHKEVTEGDQLSQAELAAALEAMGVAEGGAVSWDAFRTWFFRGAEEVCSTAQPVPECVRLGLKEDGEATAPPPLEGYSYPDTFGESAAGEEVEEDGTGQLPPEPGTVEGTLSQSTVVGRASK